MSGEDAEDLPEPEFVEGPYDGTIVDGHHKPLPRIVDLGVCERCGWVHRTCKGHSRSRAGMPCANHAKPGQLVCRKHGGNAPQNQAAAEARLARADAEGEVAELLDDARLRVEGMTGAEQLMYAIATAGAMALCYETLLRRLPVESEWSYEEQHGGQGNPIRWVNITDDGLVGPDAKGQMRLHAYEEGLRYWTRLHGELLKNAATIGLEERRQLFEEQQITKIGNAVEAIVAGLGHQLDDPKVVPVVEAALRMIAGDDERGLGAGR
jgi:hypothetical protein